MGSNFGRGVVDNVREELWSYFALTGILLVHVGIVLMVYALKDATPHPFAMEIVGGALLSMGVVTTILSWYVHRQHRRKVGVNWTRICCCCCAGAVRSSCASITDSSNDRHSDDVTNVNSKKPLQPFSTPEFQRYAEFVRQDSKGVEENGSPGYPRRLRDSNRKTLVHPRTLSESDTFNVYNHGPPKYETVALLKKTSVSLTSSPVVITKFKPPPPLTP